MIKSQLRKGMVVKMKDTGDRYRLVEPYSGPGEPYIMGKHLDSLKNRTSEQPECLQIADIEGVEIRQRSGNFRYVPLFAENSYEAGQ